MQPLKHIFLTAIATWSLGAAAADAAAVPVLDVTKAEAKVLALSAPGAPAGLATEPRPAPSSDQLGEAPYVLLGEPEQSGWAVTATAADESAPPVPIPEPSALAMLLVGAGVLLLPRRRRPNNAVH